MSKISQLTALTGAGLANGDQFLVTDVGSPNVSKSITADELAQGSQFSSRFVPKAGDRMFVGAGEMFATLGSPTLGRTNTTYDWGGWALDSASNEGVGFNFVPPPHWATYDIIAWWTNDGAGSGDVRWSIALGSYADAENTAAGASQFSVTATAGLDNVTVKTTLTTGFTDVAGEIVIANIYRLGANAADTLGNDCALLGIELVRAS